MYQSSLPVPTALTSTAKTLLVAHLLTGDRVWGVENYVYNLIATLPYNVQSMVVCSSESTVSEKFAAAQVTVQIQPISGYLDLPAARSLSMLFKRHSVDIVHTHLGLDSFIGVIAATLSGIPVVQSVHFDHPAYVHANFITQTSWRAVQALKNLRIARFLPITENVGRELAQREMVPAAKITVVYPGINSIHPIDNDCRLRTRRELGCDAEDIVVIAVGRLEEEKNFDCLIKALAGAREKQIALKLWLVGDGSQRDSLAHLIMSEKLGDVVQLLGYRNDIMALMPAADIFVLPSKKEPFGMAAVEAMSAGLPVIGTIGPGLSTIVEHQHTGLLVQPDDPTGLSEAIQQLAQDKSLRAALGKAGKERAARCFTKETMANKIALVYQEVYRQHR